MREKQILIRWDARRGKKGGYNGTCCSGIKSIYLSGMKRSLSKSHQGKRKGEGVMG